MKLSYEDHDQLTVMSIRGQVTSEDTDALRKVAIDRMENHIRDFVLDLSLTEFIDSKGIETLLCLQDEVVTQLGQVRLASCQENVTRILEITRTKSRFACHDDVETAVRSLR